MSLKVQIQDDMKSAMKAGEKDRLKVVRLILAAIKQQEIDTRKDMSDSDVLTTLNKMMKQRRDSVTQFSDGGRQDLVDIELAEIVILKEYLPEPLSDAELDALVAQAIVESGAESIRDMGKVMGLVKGRAQGRADMGAVGAKVKSRLA
jgi:uncharacterized protein YqeY